MQEVLHESRGCGRTAYPTLTGQKKCGSFSLADLNVNKRCNDKERTQPICVTKPGGSEAAVNSSKCFRDMPLRFRQPRDVPPLPQLSRAWRVAGARQLFSGGRGSGAALHFHNAAYNVLFFGTKHWVITPPRHAGVSGTKSDEWETRKAPAELPSGLPFRCSQGPGDMMLVPPMWGHATKNLGFNIGIGDLFCDARLANQTHDPQCRTPYRNYRCDATANRCGMGKEDMSRGNKGNLHRNWGKLLLRAKGKEWVDPDNAAYKQFYRDGPDTNPNPNPNPNLNPNPNPNPNLTLTLTLTR